MIDVVVAKEFLRFGMLQRRTRVLCSLRWQRFHVYVRLCGSLTLMLPSIRANSRPLAAHELNRTELT